MEGHPGDVEGTPADLLLPGDSCPSLAWLFPLGLGGTCAGTSHCRLGVDCLQGSPSRVGGLLKAEENVGLRPLELSVSVFASSTKH